MTELETLNEPQAAAAASELTLRLCGTPQDGRLIRLRGAKCTIGSDSQCTLRLRAAGVNPLHCLVLRGPERTIVRPWSGETRLNGQEFTEATLAVGDRLTIGTVEFEVVDGGGLEQTRKPARQLENRHDRARARRLLARLRELRRENDLNSLRLARLEETHARLREELANLERQKQQSCDEQSRTDAEREDHQRRLDEERRELDARRVELDDGLARLAEAQRAVAEERERIAAEETGRREGTELLASQREAEARIAVEQTNLDSARNTLDDERRNFEEFQTAWSRERDQLLADLAQRTDELNARAGELDNLRHDVESEQQRWLAEREQLRDDQERLAQGQSALAAEREQLAAEWNRLADEQRQLSHDRETLNQEQQLYSERFAELEQQRAATDHQRAACEQERAALEEDRARIESQKLLIEQELRAFEEHKHALTLERLDWQSDNSRAEAELAARREELEHRSAALEKQRGEQESARRRLEEAQKNLAGRQDVLQQAENDLVERKRQVQEQALALEAQLQTVDQDRSQLAADRQSLADGQATLTNERETLETLRGQNAVAEQELSQRLAEQARQLTEATERLNVATQELAHQQARLEASQEELDAERRQRHADREQSDAERQRLQQEFEQRLTAVQSELSRSPEQSEQQDAFAVREAEYEARWEQLNRLAEELERQAEELRRQADEMAAERKWLDERLAAVQGTNECPDEPQPIEDFTEETAPTVAVPGDEPAETGDVPVVAESEEDAFARLRSLSLLKPSAEGESDAAAETADAEPTSDPSVSSGAFSNDRPEETNGQNVGSAEYEHSGTPIAAQASDEESIDDYMVRLMKRVRGISPTSAAAAKQGGSSPPAAPKPATPPSDAQHTQSAVEDAPAVRDVPGKLNRRSAPPELSSNLAAMRELANMSARAAIDKHAYRNWGRAAFGKLTIALLASAAGIGAVYSAEGPNSMLMYAGLLSFVITLFWLLQSGILVKNVVEAARRNSRMAESVSRDVKPATSLAASAAVEADEPPPAEIITIRDSDELVATAAVPDSPDSTEGTPVMDV